ncbi:MAG: hypothetical protein LOD92_04220 [Bacillales bacterium]
MPRLIKPVRYGIATYLMTTLNQLKEAEELPELFMKSKEEMALWRTLRRVSDRIQLELDAENVDEATRVKEYRIRDISIAIEGGQLVFHKDGDKRTVPAETLKTNPTAVFRMLVNMLSRGTP